MVVYSQTMEGTRSQTHEGLPEDPHAFGAVVESSPYPSWTLPGLEPGPCVAPSIESSFIPLILVSYEPRDKFLRLAASIEEAPRETTKRWVPVDPRSESAEPEQRIGAWIEAVAARFAELLALPPDWNGHGARSIASGNIEMAGRLLASVMKPLTPAPTIVPMAGGGLQLEWHRAGFDVELPFGEGDPPLLYVREVESGREWEGAPAEGFAEFELAKRLIG